MTYPDKAFQQAEPAKPHDEVFAHRLCEVRLKQKRPSDEASGFTSSCCDLAVPGGSAFAVACEGKWLDDGTLAHRGSSVGSAGGRPEEGTCNSE